MEKLATTFNTQGCNGSTLQLLTFNHLRRKRASRIEREKTQSPQGSNITCPSVQDGADKLVAEAAARLSRVFSTPTSCWQGWSWRMVRQNWNTAAWQTATSCPFNLNGCAFSCNIEKVQTVVKWYPSTPTLTCAVEVLRRCVSYACPNASKLAVPISMLLQHKYL